MGGWTRVVMSWSFFVVDADAGVSVLVSVVVVDGGVVVSAAGDSPVSCHCTCNTGSCVSIIV